MRTNQTATIDMPRYDVLINATSSAMHSIDPKLASLILRSYTLGYVGWKLSPVSEEETWIEFLTHAVIFFAAWQKLSCDSRIVHISVQESGGKIPKVVVGIGTDKEPPQIATSSSHITLSVILEMIRCYAGDEEVRDFLRDIEGGP
jgi:hypothetical protein